MAAAPVHYIRTIHTSFTAAHPHSSSAWATHATPSSLARAHTHSAILLNLTNTSPPALPITGRKRSASIRVAPPGYPSRMQPQRVKFDPFAEDPEPSPILYNSPPPTRTRPASIPYTIQIPPAAPADIQRHHQQQQQYRRQQQQPQQVHVQVVRQPVQPRVATPPPPTPAPAPVRSVPVNAIKEREARSKIVAGILLNRVHAVGKPMRRRASDTRKPYVPSGLSTCISIEA